MDRALLLEARRGSASSPAAMPTGIHATRPMARRSQSTERSLTAAPDARAGSPVELWGDQVPIDVVAKHCGTVGYELMCAVAPRVRVVAVD